MTMFGISIGSIFGASVLLGCFGGVLAIENHDVSLGFISGCLFSMPFGFLLGRMDGREDQRKKQVTSED